MTRINGNVPVIELTDQHLFIEHRELPRVATLFRKRYLKNPASIQQSHEFRLGKNHVKFFVDKHKFCHDRSIQIQNELTIRNRNFTSYSEAWENLECDKAIINNDFVFNDSYNDIVRRRLSERIVESPMKWTYKGEKITKRQAIELLKFDNHLHCQYALNLVREYELNGNVKKIAKRLETQEQLNQFASTYPDGRLLFVDIILNESLGKPNTDEVRSKLCDELADAARNEFSQDSMGRRKFIPIIDPTRVNYSLAEI